MRIAPGLLRHASVLLWAVTFATFAPTAQASAPPDSHVLEAARQLRSTGDLAQAHALARHRLALAQKESGELSTRTATWLIEMGFILEAQNRRPIAEPYFKRALDIREKILGLHNPLTISLVNKLGLINVDLGNYAVAEPLLKRALAASQSPVTSQTATALANLASLYMTQQRFDEAEVLLLRAQAIDEKLQGPSHRLTAITLNNLGELYRLQGRFTEAEKIYNRVLAIDKKALGTQAPGYAADLSNLAALYLDTGRTDQARALLFRALEITGRKLGPQHSQLAAILGDLAKSYQTHGRTIDAERLYLRTLNIEERVHGRLHPDTTKNLNDLAKLYAETNRLQEAEVTLRRVLSINERHFGTKSTAASLTMTNLGAVLLRRNKINAALRYSRQALAIMRRTVGTANINTAHAMGAVAEILFAKQRFVESQALISQALAIFTISLPANSARIAMANYWLSRCELARGNLSNAYHYANRAAAISRSGNIAGDEAVYLHHIRTAFQAAQRHAKPNFVADAFQSADRYIAGETNAAVAQMALRFALDTNPLSLLIREQQNLHRQRDRIDRQLVFALASQDPATRAQSTALHKRLEAINARGQAIDKRLQQEHRPYAEYVEGHAVTLAQTQSLLQSGEALVLTVSADDGTYVFAVTREQTAWHRAPLTRAQIGKHASALRLQLDPTQWQGSFAPFDRQRAHLLYRHLWQPLERTLSDKTTVFVVQHGPLPAIPPSSLVTAQPQGGTSADADPDQLRSTPWLARRHAFVTLPSLSSFRALRSLSASPSGTEPFAGFGAPVTTLKNLPALPFAARELRALAQNMGAAADGNIFVGNHATETQLKTMDLSRKRVIAFATHALTPREHGTSEPGLVFSSPKRADHRDDGYLSASETAQLNLRADWIILSACNTAASANAGSEDLSGLARAFFYAGARSILVSNWPVWDDAAGRMTTATVARFQRAPRQGRAAALQNAMLAFLDDKSNPRFSHPATWASFALVGDAPAN